MESSDPKILQVLVKLLDGKHRIFTFDEPTISVDALKHRIQNLTSIAAAEQLLLINNSRVLHSHQILVLDPSAKKSESNSANWDHQLAAYRFPVTEYVEESIVSRKFPVVVNLLLRLRGGKGGFGSLLRGAATKAGQKKTKNFDACRDMSGRRLRHVNAEKKLEEWRAETEERKLEKMAEEFIRKKSKEVVKSGKKAGADSTEKYVAKYREDSEICIEKVERAVRQSVQGLTSLKRKDQSVEKESASKRLKIWFGKRKLDDSDSEDVDEDDNEEDEKSDVIDNDTHSESSKDAHANPGSVTGGKTDDGSLDEGSGSSGSEEEIVADNATGEPIRKDDISNVACIDDYTALRNHEDKVHDEVVPEIALKSQPCDANDNTSQNCGNSEAAITEVRNCLMIPEAVQEDTVHVKEMPQDLPKTLNLNEYNSAAELEVLGLENLKMELVNRGLKCGGTLQERAARLFLLKTTPLEKLPKKVLAKK